MWIFKRRHYGIDAAVEEGVRNGLERGLGDGAVHESAMAEGHSPDTPIHPVKTRGTE